MAPKKCRKFKILFIEDDVNLAEMYKFKLSMSGFDVVLCPDSRIWKDITIKTRPDLILLDILMDRKDGFDVLSEKIKSNSEEIKNIPVICLTNLASSADQEEGRRLGCKDWWIKAYNTPADVAKKTESFLNANIKNK